MNRNSKKVSTLAVALLTLVVGACSDTTGPEEGRVTAVLTDSPSGSQVAYPSARSDQPMTASSFQGQMSGSAQVFIYSEAHGWVELGSPANANVMLQSSNERTVHSQASVPAGSYTRVRLVLEGGSADIAAGGSLGGLVLSAGVSIKVGGSDGRVEIEKSVQPFTVSASSTATIRFDMNSEHWCNERNAQSETAPDEEVQSATTAEVEEE